MVVGWIVDMSLESWTPKKSRRDAATLHLYKSQYNNCSFFVVLGRFLLSFEVDEIKQWYTIVLWSLVALIACTVG